MARGKDGSDVLRYTGGGRKSPHSAYARWRKEQGIPTRCDNEECRFYTEPLVWNGKPLKPTLDHKNGVNSDDRPENLRYLCPNCNSQLGTQGGGNKDRVKKSAGGFSIEDKGRPMEYTMPSETGLYKLDDKLDGTPPRKRKRRPK